MYTRYFRCKTRVWKSFLPEKILNKNKEHTTVYTSIDSSLTPSSAEALHNFVSKKKRSHIYWELMINVLS